MPAPKGKDKLCPFVTELLVEKEFKTGQKSVGEALFAHGEER